MNTAQLIADLQSSDAAMRAAAAEQLARGGVSAQPAAVQLVRAAGDSDSTVRDWAASALESLGPPEAKSAAALAESLADPRVDLAYWAATLLGRLKTEGAAVAPALATALDSHPEAAVRERAAWALGQIGPAAASQDVRAALERAAGDPSPRLARLAKEAIRKI